MENEIFYATAATVIPLLLIALMATRSLRQGELQTQPRITILVFGLPVIGEVAAFAFLLSKPVPAAAAAILAVVTSVGLLSQLALAMWWLIELIRPVSPAGSVGHGEEQETGQIRADTTVLPNQRPTCPVCGARMEPGASWCPRCRETRHT